MKLKRELVSPEKSILASNSSNIESQEKFYFWSFIGLLSGVTLFRLFYVNFLLLTPQEAYYWNYSRHLSLSYFDHPPLTAWLIYIFTRLGTSEFSIRLPAIILSTGTSVLAFLSGKKLFDTKIAFFFVLLLNSVLLFSVGSIVTTPDAPLIFFWMLAFYLFIQLVLTRNNKWWYYLGISFGLAMLSKYTAIFMPLSIFLFLIFSRESRFWLLRKEPYVAVLISILVFAPVIIWNIQNDWASFAFQTKRRLGEMVWFSPQYFFGYISSQMGVVSPLVWSGLWYGVVRVGKSGFKNRDNKLVLLFFWSFPVMLFFTIVALKYWVKINWLAPGYLAAGLALVYTFFNSLSTAGLKKQKVAKVLGLTTLLISFIFTAGAHILPFTTVAISKADTVTGWDELGQKVGKIYQQMSGSSKTFIVGYEYKTASELAYYISERPEVYSNNIVGEHGLSYRFWSKPQELTGQNAIFVFDERNRYKNPQDLEHFFSRVDPVEVLEVFKGKKIFTRFHIFRCYNYKGLE